MDVSLSPALQKRIDDKVEAGRYRDASEVIEQALRLLDDHDKTRRLREELAVGLAQIERGETVPYTPDFIERLTREAKEDARLGKPIRDVIRP